MHCSTSHSFCSLALFGKPEHTHTTMTVVTFTDFTVAYGKPSRSNSEKSVPFSQLTVHSCLTPLPNCIAGQTAIAPSIPNQLMSTVRHYPASSSYLSFKNWTAISPWKMPDVILAIRGLKNKKSTGQDAIPPEILKSGDKPLLTALFRIFTNCWNRRCLPDEFRDTIITLYRNKGDRGDCNNYRGISLLCISWKILLVSSCPQSVRLKTEFYLRVNVAFAPLDVHHTWYFH